MEHPTGGLPSEQSISIKHAQAQFSSLVKRAKETRERIVITWRGEPVAAIIAADELTQLPAMGPGISSVAEIPPADAAPAVPATPLVPDADTVTLKDVAERCGVHLSTVALAFNAQSQRRMRPETRARILSTAREMGYNPELHSEARRLAFRKSGRTMIHHAVAVFFELESLEQSYHTRQLHTAMDELMSANYDVVSHRIHPAYMQESIPDIHGLISYALPRIILRGDIDGAILFCAPRDDMYRLLTQLRGSAFAQRPIVSIITPLPGCSSVLCDDFAGGYALASHLLDLGHRHLAHCYTEHEYSHTLRIDGYRHALCEHRLDPEVHLHYYSLQDIPNDLPRLLRRHPEITGIMAPNDPFAGTIHALLQELGYRVPEDYSLTGFDDTDPILDEQGHNILTTVTLRLEEIGSTAARMMIHQITHPDAPIESVQCPITLTIRSSTAPPHHV